MARLLWLAPALVALGLWASLLPQATFSSAASGEPVGGVLVAWPGWAVQQEVGPVAGTVGRFQIWVSSEPGGAHVTLEASLVEASTRKVIRQTSIEVTPGYIPASRTLLFPHYVVPEGQQLLVQLQVADFEHNYVVYRLTASQPGLANLALNGVPDVGSGPLAFTHLWTGSGLRAAAIGDLSSRIRLALAVASGGLAVLAHPSVGTRLRRMGATVRNMARRPKAWRRSRVRSGAEPAAGLPQTTAGRFLSTPWYPWPAAAVPILHFLGSNSLHFTLGEAVVPIGIAMLVVTGSVVCAWLLLKDWHRAAAAITAVTVVFFAYGHVERALESRVDEGLLFPAAVVLGAVAVGIAVRAGALVARGTQFFNSMAAVLLVFPVVSLVAEGPWISDRTSLSEPEMMDGLTSHLSPRALPRVGSRRPDIYCIILDAYARQDALGDFDNTDFLNELQRRGFYVATEATSNYKSTIHSLSSSLNMEYLDGLGKRVPTTTEEGINVLNNNALAAIVKELGYTYVHLESGNVISSKAPLSDILVTFTPAGVVVDSGAEETLHSHYARADGDNSILKGGFLRALVETTALRPVAGHRFQPGEDSPYDWWAADRTLQMFDFLSGPINVGGPKFVFAHIVKPHRPATFDRYGNRTRGASDSDEFSDSHDPTVPDAYIGQLIFINSLVLKMIDGIFTNHDDDPIIVIAGDHGRSGEYPRHATLAAFHLPDGGSDALYSSISSVNHFRAILDFYFGLDLGLLEDLQLEHTVDQFDIPVASPIGGTRR